MKGFTVWFKRIFSFLFKSSKASVQHTQVAEQKESPLKEAEHILQKYKKKKEEVVHRIPPNPFTMPRSHSFKKGLGNVQQIVVWDGEHFPGRWRTRLIYHG